MHVYWATTCGKMVGVHVGCSNKSRESVIVQDSGCRCVFWGAAAQSLHGGLQIEQGTWPHEGLERAISCSILVPACSSSLPAEPQMHVRAGNGGSMPQGLEPTQQAEACVLADGSAVGTWQAEATRLRKHCVSKVCGARTPSPCPSDVPGLRCLLCFLLSCYEICWKESTTNSLDFST